MLTGKVVSVFAEFATPRGVRTHSPVFACGPLRPKLRRFINPDSLSF